MTFLDVCEELAHAWGQLPGVVLTYPWVLLKRWVEIHGKRKRREWKQQIALARLSSAGAMGGMLGGGEKPAAETTDQDRITALQSLGLGSAVATLKKE